MVHKRNQVYSLHVWIEIGSKKKTLCVKYWKKIEIIENLEKGDSGFSLVQFYNIGKSTIGR